MCGIYKITNLINGKCYIGQSVDINKRFYTHKSDAFNPGDKKYNYPLYKAFRKYGLDNFSFEILEECKRSELNEREILYIAQYDSYHNGYNQNEGGNPAPYAIYSDDTIDKIIKKLKTSTDNSKIIAEEFGVSQRLVIGINRGEYRRKDNEQYPIRQHLNTIKSTLVNQSQQDMCESMDVHKKIKKAKTVNRCKNCGVITKCRKSKLCEKCMHLSQRKTERPDPLELAKLIKENGFKAVGRMFGVSDKAVVRWCVEYKIPNTKKEVSLWYEAQVGLKHAEAGPEHKKRKEDIVKPVNQIDIISRKIINTFANQSQAARYFGSKDGTHIGQVCRGERETAFGYIWQFA